MRVKNSDDRTDKIIIDRITNKNPRPRTNINILDFMNGVDKIQEASNSRDSKQIFSFVRQKNVQRQSAKAAINDKDKISEDSFESDFESEKFSSDSD